MTEELLRISAMEKSHRTRSGELVRVLRDVDLTIRQGEFVALHGPSGCGKTTLLHCAGGLSRPDGGWVRVAGVDPYAMPAAKRPAFRAAHIGFVFQDFQLVPYLTVLDNVMICALAGANRDTLAPRAIELLGKFGLGHRLQHHPTELSVGEQQRVALVRAMAGGAALVLADEPTGNLDAANARLLMEHLAQFAANGGAVLLVTHDPIASDHATACRDLRDGRIETI